MSKQEIIVIRPIYDDPTIDTFGWAKNAIRAVGTSSIVDLAGTNANEESLRTAITNSSDIRLIAFYGHGQPTYMLSDQSGVKPNQVLINLKRPGVQVNELPMGVFYAVACYSGLDLGEKISKSGIHFIGYKGPLMWVPDFSNYFGEVANLGFFGLARDKKPSAEVKTSLAASWTELIVRLSEGDLSEEFEAFNAAQAAINNLEHLIHHSPASKSKTSAASAKK